MSRMIDMYAEEISKHYGRIFDRVDFNYQILRCDNSECHAITTFGLDNGTNRIELIRIYVDDEGVVICDNMFSQIFSDNATILKAVATIIKNFCVF